MMGRFRTDGASNAVCDLRGARRRSKVSPCDLLFYRRFDRRVVGSMSSWSTTRQSLVGNNLLASAKKFEQNSGDVNRNVTFPLSRIQSSFPVPPQGVKGLPSFWLYIASPRRQL